jgi:outer membrane protein assembly factor BamE (lipoprotein component of BamABCDE complex)
MTLARTTALAVVIAAAAAAACTPIVRRHGYVPEEMPLSAITPSVDTKASVLDRYGNPSTSAVFDENTWYYITNVREQLGYLQPESSARSITAVHFDDYGRVAEVNTLSLADARNPAIVGRKTPTRGRELTILEQLLGNVGRLPSQQMSNQDDLPGGAGGPRRE